MSRNFDPILEETMDPTPLHEDQFLRILWDEQTKIISIDWRDATSAMTSEQFKAELLIFATFVELQEGTGYPR